MLYRSPICLLLHFVAAILKRTKKTTSVFVKSAYLTNFGARVEDQNKQRISHIACKTCVEHLRNRKMEKYEAYSLVSQWFGKNVKLS